MKSRRQFIQRCSGALLGAAVAPAFALPAPQGRLAGFTAFSGQAGTRFTLTDAASGRALAVVLAAVDPFFPKGRPEQADHTNFRLKFASTSGSQVLEQGIHSFDHPVLGRQDLFVVPHESHKVPGQINYVATFHGAPMV